MTEPPRAPRRPDELLLDELTDQLDRTRSLLTGSPADVAERALGRIGGDSEADARLASDLARGTPLAAPARFEEAHRLVMRAIEVLDRDGSRNPPVGGFAPLRAIALPAVEFVAEFIVRSYTKRVVGDLGKLYAQRESQSLPGSPERRVLTRARVDMQRLAPAYSGGGVGAPLLLVAGAMVPVLASLGQQLGAIDFNARWVLVGAAISLLLFVSLSWLLLRGAALARHRSQLIVRQPLAALWETIGGAGTPPEDAAVLFATIAIVLTALVWFALPALAGLGFVFF
ncbi:MAG: hypothetical protein O3A10_13070 [Chloroflexi bacterium]|nr:hypothetical protein [Chloroflexota bacterium]MDA1147471.1 hypothetical protein [Chloroflexota bacterium]MQC83036.1 hypothetical protein [Chloroflexota bacterium]